MTPASVETITFVTAFRRCLRSSCRLIARRAVSFASARSAPKSVAGAAAAAFRLIDSRISGRSPDGVASVASRASAGSVAGIGSGAVRIDDRAFELAFAVQQDLHARTKMCRV